MEERWKGHANGFKPNTVKNQARGMPFSVPQVSEGESYLSVSKLGLRREKDIMII